MFRFALLTIELNVVSSVPTIGFKFIPIEQIKAPDKIPINREDITSFVIKARAIASIGGIIESHPAYNGSKNFPPFCYNILISYGVNNNI